MERAQLRTLLRATGCAVERGEFVFLCDPGAAPAERAERERLIARQPIGQGETGAGWLGVRTGGSGGGVKFARHDEATLSTAVRGFCAHFALETVNAVDVLPAHHVSGLMARVRCAATGGQHVPWDWKRLEAGAVPALPGGDWVISLVPTQLQRLLPSEGIVAWLRQFRIIFLGGGPVWNELTNAAAAAELRLSLSYGMTESAAMVAALRPEEFLAGARSVGTVLPHARVRLAAGEVVAVAGDSIFHGYWPAWSAAREFTTEDLGRIDERGQLHILGRRDAMIISGGKKVQPADVEAALRASGEFADVVVIGLPDREWGEVVVACYPGGRTAPDFERAVAGLAAFQRPKRFVAIADWPRNAQGKVNRAALRAFVASAGLDPRQ